MATKKGGKKAAKKAGGAKKGAAKKGAAKKAAKKRQFEPAGTANLHWRTSKVHETFQKERRILQAKFVVPLVSMSQFNISYAS